MSERDIGRIWMGCGNFGGIGSSPRLRSAGDSEETALQLLDQLFVLPRPGFEIGILRMEVGEDIRIIDLGIFGIAKPVPRVLDGDSVALIAVRAPFGLRRSGKADGLVHAALLTPEVRACEVPSW